MQSKSFLYLLLIGSIPAVIGGLYFQFISATGATGFLQIVIYAFVVAAIAGIVYAVSRLFFETKYQASAKGNFLLSEQ
jgi:uncharacterized membrane protein YkvI